MTLQFFCYTAHFHPFDSYAPHDPNNGYPQHFCDLNDDEFGRPYLGPFDQHVDSSARNPFPKVPPPDKWDTADKQDEPTQRPSKYQTLPPVLKDLLGGGNIGLPNGKKRDGGHEFMKRQNPPLPGCTALNECSAPRRKLPFCTLIQLLRPFLQRDAEDPVRSTTRAEGGAHVRVDF